MEIRMQSHMTAENFLTFSKDVWDVIWIRNSCKIVPSQVRKYAKSLIDIIFDDIDVAMGCYIMPMSIDVNRALTYSEGKKNLLVSCYNGTTRCAAVAYICKCKESGPEEAIKILDKDRHHPNRRVIKLASEILKDHNIYNVYAKWSRIHSFNF